MRIGPKFVTIAAFVIAAALSYVSAMMAAGLIERSSQSAVRTVLIEGDHEWATVVADGLQVRLTGIAPSEAERFRALSATGTVVDAARVLDGIEVAPGKPITAPDFSIEILRNDEGVSMIGLIPASVDRDAFTQRISDASDDATIIDLLETADYPVPDGWKDAVKYGLDALKMLPRSKISIAAKRVAITAISTSGAEKRQLDARLARNAPANIELSIDITAPRPVITPFTLRFLIDEAGNARFDACSADTEAARTRILAAARSAGLEGEANCVLGLGVPTPEWANAAVLAIEAVGTLGGGSVTFSDADVSLVATAETPQAAFDRVVGELESNLPDVFSLASKLPEKVNVDGTGETDQGPPEFVATRATDGKVQLRGRVTNALAREAVESFSRARFGSEAVLGATRLDPNLPDGWPIRVLAGVEALAGLDNGTVIVQPTYIEVRGQTGDPDAKAEIARHLAQKLGEGQHFKIDVTYEEALDPLAALPTPDQCVSKIRAILAQTKITFEPGSTEISGPSVAVMDKIAAVLKEDCAKVDMHLEIAGYTDSQGRESMNQQLSQQRADAVLNALIARRVLTSRITSVGYGEENPIADNGTEEGREDNRRIEFRLIKEREDEAADAAETIDEAATDGSNSEAALPLNQAENTGPEASDAANEENTSEADDSEQAETAGE